jgi:hypothetical protein
MISAVPTSTSSAADITTIASVLITIVLIIMLVAWELLSTSTNVRFRIIRKSLAIGIIPLLLGFIIIVALKIANIIG